MPGPTTTTPKLWLKANTGVYKDAGVTLAAGGETVQQWNDQSGNGNHALQSSGGNRPTYNTSPSRVTGNGTSSWMVNAFTGDPLTGYAVIKHSASAYATASGGRYTPGAASDLDAYYIGIHGASVDEYSYPTCYKRITTSDPSSGGAVTDGFAYAKEIQGAWHFISWRQINSHIQLFLNGALFAQKRLYGTPRVVDAASIFAGYYNHTVADHWAGEILECGMYDSALSNSEIDSLHDYLSTTYSITRYDVPVSLKYRLTCFLGDNQSREFLAQFSSSDGITWLHRNVYYYPQSGQYVRDASCLTHNGIVYAAHTSEDFPTAGSSDRFAVASSLDAGVNYSNLVNVDCSAVTPTHAWAPEFFNDNGTIYIFWTDDNQLYYVTNTASDLSTWSTPVAVSGLSGGGRLDPCMVKVSSTYYLFYSILISTGGIGYATSSTANGTYTEQKSGSAGVDWAGWIAAVNTATGASVTLEAPSILPLETGGYRLYFDAYAGATRYGLWYTDNATSNFSSPGAWTTPAQATSSSGLKLRHGTTIKLATLPFLWALNSNQITGD